MAEARRATYAIEPDRLLVLLAEKLSVFKTPKNWADQSKTYVAALMDLPPDLLEKALDIVVATYEYQFPRPATIRKTVEAELVERVGAVRQLEYLAQHGTFPAPPRAKKTPQELAEIDELMQRYRRGEKLE